MRSLAAVLFIVVSGQAIADESQQTALNEVCKASLISKNAAIRTARELGITKAQRDRLVCNDMSLDLFAKTYSVDVNNFPSSPSGDVLVNIQ